MQALAARNGVGDTLRNAMKMHSEVLETFHDSPHEPATNAGASLRETAPEYVKERDRTERLRMLARYDPQIEAGAERILDLRKRRAALGTEVGARPALAPLPEAPILREAPEAPEARPYPQPEATRAIDPPMASEPKLPDPPEMKDRPSRPNLQAYERPEVDVSKLNREQLGALQKRLNFNQYDIGILVSSSLLSPLVAMIGREAGVLVHAAGYSYLGGKLLTSYLLDQPSVIRFLTGPTPEQSAAIEKLPHLEKIKVVNGLTEAAAESARRGRSLRLAPSVLAMIGPANSRKVAEEGVIRSPGDAKRRLQSLIR